MEDAQQTQELSNSLSQLVGALGTSPVGFANVVGQQLSQTQTMWANCRWYLISNQQNVLSQMYVEHGVIQTLVDQPVDDSFAAGYEIKSGQLSGEDIEELEVFLEESSAIESLKQACKWARLFGGGAVLIMTNQKASTPLTIDQLQEGSPLEFRAIDQWELNTNINNPNVTDMTPNWSVDLLSYYGVPVHKSRILIIKGKEAPSLVRRQLRGWGMSEVERLVRSMNQYLKNQDVVFELLDEAKIDVYRMKGFNQQLLSPSGTEGAAKRVQAANMIKNYQHALVMDQGDEYEQKQISFSGLPDMLTQIRQGIAADVKMPMTKLWGISAAGFNSGEDDIENYNSMCKSEVQVKSKRHIISIIKIACQIRFGFVPDDLKIVWKSMRQLSALDEETVKDKKFNRVMNSYNSGLIDSKDAKDSINKDSLLPVEIDPNAAPLAPLDTQFVESNDSSDKRTTGARVGDPEV